MLYSKTSINDPFIRTLPLSVLLNVSGANTYRKLMYQTRDQSVLILHIRLISYLLVISSLSNSYIRYSDRQFFIAREEVKNVQYSEVGLRSALATAVRGVKQDDPAWRSKISLT